MNATTTLRITDKAHIVGEAVLEKSVYTFTHPHQFAIYANYVQGARYSLLDTIDISIIVRRIGIKFQFELPLMAEKYVLVTYM